MKSKEWTWHDFAVVLAYKIIHHLPFQASSLQAGQSLSSCGSGWPRSASPSRSSSRPTGPSLMSTLGKMFDKRFKVKSCLNRFGQRHRKHAFRCVSNQDKLIPYVLFWLTDTKCMFTVSIALALLTLLSLLTMWIILTLLTLGVVVSPAKKVVDF